MAYPRDVLAHDEELLLHRHPHWKMLVLPALTLVVVTALAGFGVGFAGRRLDGTARTVVLAVIAGIWLLLVAWRSVAPLLRWRFTHFIVTDRRVLVRQGIVTQSGIDIPMGRISNVQFRHGLVDRLFRTGTLILASASDDPLEFDDIPRVEKVHSLLYHQVFDAMDVHGERRTRWGSDSRSDVDARSDADLDRYRGEGS